MSSSAVRETIALMEQYPFPSRTPVAPVIPVYREPTRPEIEALSLAQQIGLLQLSKTTRAVAIWGSLRQKFSAPPCTRSTFVELAQLGYDEKPQGQDYHRLTVKGFRAADLATDILQEQFQIHAGYLLGAVRATVTLKCTCGWGCGLRRGNNMQAKAASAMTTHLITLEAVEGLRKALAPFAPPSPTREAESA